MSIKLEAGQWYRTRGGQIVYCVGRKPHRRNLSYPFVVCDEIAAITDYNEDGFVSTMDDHRDDIVEHLPGCTGFDWEPPKPIEPPSQWRLLTEGEVIESHDKWWSGSEWTELLSGRSSVGEKWSSRTHHLFIRKMEPKYRPFRNAEEFNPHRDRWVMRAHRGFENEVGCYRIEGYDDEGVWIDKSRKFTYKQEFESNRRFEDGTPFGVRVDD